MQMTEAQRRAVTHRNGPAIILAGPGSGKTLVITQRIKYLIDTCKINPREILVLTFTKAAARQMQERFQMNCSSGGTYFGTCHAAFFGILKQADHYTSKDVVSEQEKLNQLRRLLSEYGEEELCAQDTLALVAAGISRVKNERLSPEEAAPSCCAPEIFREVLQKYEQAHRRQHLVDFDEMLTCTLDLLRKREDLLVNLRQRWRYILVDEFQDINCLQYEILRLLAFPENNLFVVGDDDQSIYRFRGASPEILLSFPKDYPDAEQILLDQNFRSSSDILEGANHVIEKNISRYRKDIRPARPSLVPIEKKSFLDQDHESLYLVREIQKRISEGVPHSEIAVLLRLNAQAGPFAGRLAEFNIPFRMRGGFPCVYDHWVARDVFAYLRLAHEGLKRSDFLRVMNRPERNLSRACVEGGTVSLPGLLIYYREDEKMRERIEQLASDLEMLWRLPPFAAVNYIKSGMGYGDFLRQYAIRRRQNPEEYLDVLEELQESAKPFRSLDDWIAQIGRVRASMRAGLERTEKNGAEAVPLLTLHASKGLEFSEVFLPDVNERILPHERALLKEEMEEERRLFYVGMTRAKDRLHVFYIRQRYGKVMEPSRFLEDF